MTPSRRPGVRVRFEEVGPSKRTWEATLPELSDVALYREIRQSGALASRGIDFGDEGEGRGGIWVGGFRRVGSWRYLGLAE